MEATSDITNSNIMEFSIKLYNTIKTTQNLIFSPASIYFALALAAIGASGKTLEEFKKVIGIDNPLDMAQSINELQKTITSSSGEGIIISTVNKIYTGLPEIGKEYLNLMMEQFDSAFENVDFKHKSEPIRNKINKEVSAATNNKINNLLSKGSIDKDTLMLLVNTLYFKGDWLNPFKSNKTQIMDFSIGIENGVKGQYSKVEMMYQQTKYEYFENSNLYQYVSLPYKGDDFVMEIILPKKGSLSDLESAFSSKLLIEARKQKQSQKVSLFLPKFKIEECTLDLTQILQGLGLSHPFTDKADFSFMDPNRIAKISSVIHKAMIEVNEKGAIAAAVTVAQLRKKSKKAKEEIIEMRCDHPFLFTLMHVPTQTLLFIGKITNPV